MNKIAVVGGSGLYDASWIGGGERISVGTPFDDPSGDVVMARRGGVEIFFLPRHGEGHVLMPSEINHRANIFALKKLGVTHILSISAVGSLKETLAPRDVVFVDQYFDRTKRSHEHTFFGKGCVAHVGFGDPVCPELGALAFRLTSDAAWKLHGGAAGSPKVVKGGSYVNMEGPAFSTKAESNAYRALGMDVIGMTNLGEAKLAREAEICYCTMAMVTDYDCWHPDHDHVTIDVVRANFAANVGLAKAAAAAVADAAASLPRSCKCKDAMAGAIITDPKKIPVETLRRLEPIIGRHIGVA